MSQRRAATDGTLDEMPSSITKAIGVARVVDRRSDRDLRCLSPQGMLSQAWHVLKGEFVGEDGHIYSKRVYAPADVEVVPGHKMIDLALAHCHHCPAQWDCAETAVEVGELWGTWAMRLDDLIWLQGQTIAGELIARARERALPVQVAVKEARVRTG
jgi:hypothetical protein